MTPSTTNIETDKTESSSQKLQKIEVNNEAEEGPHWNPSSSQNRMTDLEAKNINQGIGMYNNES